MAWVAVILGVIISASVGLIILSEFLTQIDADYGNDSYAHNGTVQGLDALSTIPSWMPLIVLVVVAGFLMLIARGSIGG